MPIRCLRWPIFVALILVGASHAAAQQPTSLRLSERTTLRLATAEEGKTLITRRDDFIAALSLFDLQSRLKTDQPVKVDELLDLYRENVTEWPAEDAAAVLKAFETVRERLGEIVLPLPETVSVVRTTGKEESGAAYCRGPAIVLPENLIHQSASGLERLVAHELFHVLSSHNADLRRDLYAIIGFTLCEPIAPPASLKDRTIANPDAPRIDCIMQLELADGEQVTVAPLLVASPGKFDPAAGKSMFAYLQFRLMAVEQQGQRWVPVLVEGEARLIDPRRVDSFWKQIGRNTGYIIHPDEILADNFAHFIMQTAKLPAPEIVEKLQARLAQRPATAE